MAFVISEGAVTSVAPTLGTPRVTGGLRDYRDRWVDWAAIWRSQSNVRTVVGWRARQMSQLGLKLYERVSDDERRYLADHPLNVLLHRPTPRMSMPRMARDLESDAGLYGVKVLVKVNAGGTRALLRVPPSAVTPVGGGWQGAEKYRIHRVGGPPVDLPWDQVVLIPEYNPDDPRWGVSPIETLRRILAEDMAAGEYREGFWKRGARVSGVIERSHEAPEWSDPARQRFEESWAAGWGENVAGVPLLEDGMTFRQVSLDAQESEYLGARKLTRAEVCAAFYVLPSLLGIDVTSGEELSESRRIGLADTLGPICHLDAAEMALQTFPDYPDLDLSTHYLEHTLEEKLRGSFKEQAEVLSRSVGRPFLTANEARSMMNRAPVEEGEGLAVPLNLLIGGRASPADTAPGSPGAGQVPELASRSPRGKSVDELPAPVQPWVAQTAELVGRHLARQRQDVVSRIGAGQTIEAAFGVDGEGGQPRWDEELTNDLAGLSLSMMPEMAEPVAEQFDLDEVDVAPLEAWVLAGAEASAKAFNAATLRAVERAIEPQTASRAKELEEVLEAVGATPLSELAGDVFESTSESRAAQFALGRVLTTLSFTRTETAKQGGATSKTWHTISAQPRQSHRNLNGVTIGIGERFANGGLWPGDPALPAEELAHCNCQIDFN